MLHEAHYKLFFTLTLCQQCKIRLLARVKKWGLGFWPCDSQGIGSGYTSPGLHAHWGLLVEALSSCWNAEFASQPVCASIHLV